MGLAALAFNFFRAHNLQHAIHSAKVTNQEAESSRRFSVEDETIPEMFRIYAVAVPAEAVAICTERFQ